MPGVDQQIPSFAFNAAEDGVAPKKVQMDGFLDNQFRVRATRDGTFETTKALVIKKNFQSHLSGWGLSTDRALKSTGLWRDSINGRELKAVQTDGNFAC